MLCQNEIRFFDLVFNDVGRQVPDRFAGFDEALFVLHAAKHREGFADPLRHVAALFDREIIERERRAVADVLVERRRVFAQFWLIASKSDERLTCTPRRCALLI